MYKCLLVTVSWEKKMVLMVGNFSAKAALSQLLPGLLERQAAHWLSFFLSLSIYHI